MKTTYILIGLALLAGIIVYLASCKNKQTAEQTKSQSPNDTAKVQPPSANPYQDLRNMALGATPEQLQLTIPIGQTKVFGVVMDWDVGVGIATFIAFETGDASMYLSSGGGTIGGSGNENVKNAAKVFVNKAQTYLDKTAKTYTTPLPDKDCVRFYLLTNKGKFTAQEQLQNFKNNKSIWLPLFEEANEVITELRMAQENTQKK